MSFRKQFIFGGMTVLATLLIVAAALYLISPGLILAGGNGSARALLRDQDGKPVGVVRLNQERDGKVLIRANVHDLPPGFHGFHVHAVGRCEPPFTSAGGHLNPGGHGHPDHAADLPVLLVNSDGTGESRVKTDRFAVSDLLDADGSAIIIHAKPDNYANIPADRYSNPDGVPDAMTLATGDAGGRIACGVIQ